MQAVADPGAIPSNLTGTGGNLRALILTVDFEAKRDETAAVRRGIERDVATYL